VGVPLRYQIQVFEALYFGGPGVIVQIDESKVGKRKYNRGRLVEGHWVFGAIDMDTDELRIIVCPGNKRDWATLGPIIQQHIKPGTIIMSDCWKAYGNLSQFNYFHTTVNHSDPEFCFVAEDGVTNTQKIESIWRPFKN